MVISTIAEVSGIGTVPSFLWPLINNRVISVFSSSRVCHMDPTGNYWKTAAFQDSRRKVFQLYEGVTEDGIPELACDPAAFSKT